jgi:hypothetical protein
MVFLQTKILLKRTVVLENQTTFFKPLMGLLMLVVVEETKNRHVRHHLRLHVLTTTMESKQL